MSKSLGNFWSKWASPSNFLARVTGRTLTPGSRLLPVSKGEDGSAEYRVDAGEKIGDKQNLVLQVNSQAKSPALKKYVAKSGRGTHAKLAVATFDTKAADPAAEIKKVIAEMDAQAKKKLG